MIEFLLIAFVVLALVLMLGGGKGFGAVFGWLWRSTWAFIVWLWVSPVMRLVLAGGLLVAVVIPWFWCGALVGTPGVVWAAIVVAAACALWGVAASSVHHVSPNWWRGLAIARSAGYAALCGPLALALGATVTKGTLGTLLGIVAWLLIAGGLTVHLTTGSEFKQAPIQ